jgi:hypothetical protein
MTDLYRITGDSPSPDRPPAAGPRTAVLPALFWTVLVVSAVGNSVSSLGGVPMPVHLGFGIVTAVCIAGLLAGHLRRRP